MAAHDVQAAAAAVRHVAIGGQSVEIAAGTGVTADDAQKALDSVPFKQWAAQLTGSDGILTLGGSGGARCTLHRITIQSVDFFGPRVGFVKFKVDITDDETGSKLPGIVFARGGAVGILILLDCDGEKLVVLTEQARVPVGRAILELPAGMLDDGAGDFVGTAAREVEEETGIHIRAADLVNLTDFLDAPTGRRMYPSPGGSDETITLFLWRGRVGKEVVEGLRGRQTGLRDHGELISVRCVPYSSLWRASADAKVLAAVALYEGAAREGRLPPAPNAPELSGL